MIERLINRNLAFLKKHISCDDDAVEVYRYSLRIIYSYIIDVLVLMSMAFVAHKAIETVIILFTFAVMQVYGGGYHADTEIGCLSIMAVGWFIGVFAMERVVSLHWSIGIGVGMIFTVSVFALTPVLNQKHPIGGDVYIRSKKIVRVSCLLIDVILTACVFADIKVVYNALSIMMVLYSVSLFCGRMKARRAERSSFD